MKTFAAKIFAVVLLGCALNAQAYSVYSNTNAAGDQEWVFKPGSVRIGDEVQLAASGFLTHVEFQYYGTNFSGNEYLQVSLFKNDDLGNSISLQNRTAYGPGTELFNFAAYPIPVTDIDGFEPRRKVFGLDAGVDFSTGILLDNSYNYTLAVQFSGIESGEVAGISLYDYPSVGASYDTYWQYNGSVWNLTTNGSTPNGFVDFGMQIEAVPEPSVISLAVMGGLVALGFGRFFGKK